MKVLYLSCYPEKVFLDFLRNGVAPSQAAQKFNKLFVKGLCLNGYDVDVVLVSGSDIEDGIVEEYAGKTINYKVHNLSGKLLQRVKAKTQFIKQIIKEYSKENKNGIVVVDALASGATEISVQAKKYGLSVISIITDFYSDTLGKGSLYTRIRQEIRNRIFYRQFSYSDLYVILAPAMAERLPSHAPCFLTNGICDSEMREPEEYESEGKVCMYTGEIRKMYGIHNLVEAFLKVNDSEAQLHLYGHGMDNYPELKTIIEENPCIKYFGTVPNSQIIEVQKKASFLINPRLVTGFGDYVKYSFPSKNVEYLMSGKPLIATKLPSMVEKYEDYVYFFEDDTVEGMEKTLRYCFSLSKEELAAKAAKARHFAYDSMNNKTVVEKMLESLCPEGAK